MNAMAKFSLNVLACFLLSNFFLLGTVIANDSELCMDGTAFSVDFGKGVSSEQIDPEVLVPLCEKALIENPDNSDIKFGLARALHAKKEYSKSFFIFSELSKSGHPDATALLADYHYYGYLGSQSFQRFFELSLAAHHQGSVYGTTNLYYAYHFGFGVDANDEEAIIFLEDAAERGSSLAKTILAEALIYESLAGLRQDIPRAKNLLLEEIAKGDRSSEAVFHSVTVDFPENRYDLMLSLSRLKELAIGGSEDASFTLIKAYLDPKWYQEIGKKFDIEPELALGAQLILGLTETSYGMSLLSNIISPEMGETIDTVSAKKLLSKLDAVARDENKLNRNASINAAQTLAWIYGLGVFAPADVGKRLEYLTFSVEKYGDTESAIDAGWIYWVEPSVRDIVKARHYTKIGTTSEEPNLQAYAHNNLGVIIENSDLPDRDQLAEIQYLRAAEIIQKSDFLNFWPFENLARLVLKKSKSGNIDLQKFKKFARLSQEKGASGFFVNLFERYPINETTPYEKIKVWMEKEALAGVEEAFIELGYLADYERDDVSALKWFNLCRVLCTEEDRERANDFLSRQKEELRGLLIVKGENEANEWLIQNLTAVNLARASQTKNNQKDVGAASRNDLKPKGTFHALLIGVSSYDNFESLRTPILDIKKIGNLLSEKYYGTVKYLENATRSEMTSALNNLVKVVKPQDAVLIYFAGHGLLEDETQEGYWLPKDAVLDDDTNYLSNSYIRNKLRAIKATNVLLVADTCFSGSLVSRGVELPISKTPKTAIEKYLQTKSRVVIASGGLKPVLDGGAGLNSIFAGAFVDVLEKNDGPITSAKLYLAIRDTVTQRSLALGVDQTPIRGELPIAGHEGPDFVLIPK